MKCMNCQQPLKRTFGEPPVEHAGNIVTPCLEPVIDITHSAEQERADYSLQTLQMALNEFTSTPTWRWLARRLLRSKYRRLRVAAEHACGENLRDPWDELYCARLQLITATASLLEL